MRKQTRRGQIALFVVIGLVILIAVLLGSYLLRERLFGQAEMEVLPADFEPVQQHLQACLRDTTVEALKTMAMHGGYLDVRDERWTDGPLVINPLDPTQSDAVLLNEGDNESGVPYYYYLKGSNECQRCLLGSLTPSVERMEAQARAYVLQHLHECVNYGAFPDLHVTADSKQELTITLLNESVLIRYERILDLAKGETTVRARVFTQEVPFPYRRAYEAAKLITQREITTQYLENYLLYLLTAYGGINNDLPPIAGVDESFTPKFWILLNVQQTYQHVLASTTPLLQVQRTSGALPLPATDDPYVQGLFTTVSLDLFPDAPFDPARYRVSIFNPRQPIYLDIQPRKGQLVKPRSEKTSGILFIPPRQVNYYDFGYDVSVPFLIEIREENAMPGEDLSFVFALEANVRKNKNMVEWLLGRGPIPWSNDFVTYDVNNPEEALQNGSTNVSAQRYFHNSSLKSLLCNPAAWTTPLSVKTFDARTGDALDGVSFTFTCGYYGSCDVGPSLLDEHGRYALFDAKVPSCTGGLLKAEKEGYVSTQVKVSTRGAIPVKLPDLSLEPYVPVKVRLEKLHVKEVVVQHGGYSMVTEQLADPRPLNATDSAFVSFTRKPFNEYDEPVSGTVVFMNDTIMDEITLIPGLYEVKAFYLDENGFTIPAKCMRVCSDRSWKGCDEYTYLPENATEVKPAPLGGLELGEQTRYFQIERNQLYGASTLVVPVFIAPTPTCIDDLENMGETKRYTRTWIQQAMPRFE